ncbi:MAG TPA: helix-turn-helix domain-containing protein [Frateuria sp.]|uniref:helix-turn-helix domain-containing protein n=1 Tax=Frateuria sp. TaxID=2211372 RepID=UPI002D80AF56|nr:helix-turn-helix domain-containing protein [Frateuria sp.]HET6805651.1 helix-turn-helix domain-containing protein [Frateuria sp.]
MADHLSPQHEAILAELRKGPATTMQLIKRCGVICVQARLHELKTDHGYAIGMQMVTVRDRRRATVRVAQYSLLPNTPAKRAA